MRNTNIELGDRVEDEITGFQGIVVARLDYLNGCLRFMVQAENLDKDGKPGTDAVFDVEQLKVIKQGVHKVKAVSGGPMPTPPRRR